MSQPRARLVELGYENTGGPKKKSCSLLPNKGIVVRRSFFLGSFLCSSSRRSTRRGKVMSTQGGAHMRQAHLCEGRRRIFQWREGATRKTCRQQSIPSSLDTLCGAGPGCRARRIFVRGTVMIWGLLSARLSPKHGCLRLSRPFFFAGANERAVGQQ